MNIISLIHEHQISAIHCRDTIHGLRIWGVSLWNTKSTIQRNYGFIANGSLKMVLIIKINFIFHNFFVSPLEKRNILKRVSIVSISLIFWVKLFLKNYSSPILTGSSKQARTWVLPCRTLLFLWRSKRWQRLRGTTSRRESTEKDFRNGNRSLFNCKISFYLKKKALR